MVYLVLKASDPAAVGVVLRDEAAVVERLGSGDAFVAIGLIAADSRRTEPASPAVVADATPPGLGWLDAEGDGECG